FTASAGELAPLVESAVGGIQPDPGRKRADRSELPWTNTARPLVCASRPSRGKSAPAVPPLTVIGALHAPFHSPARMFSCGPLDCAQAARRLPVAVGQRATSGLRAEKMPLEESLTGVPQVPAALRLL